MTEIVQLKEVDDRIFQQLNRLKLMDEFGPFPFPSIEPARGVVADENSELWVIRDGEEIVGMATLVGLYTLSGLHMNVEHVVVDEHYRGKGLGKALIRKLIDRAKARKADSIGLTSRPARVAANKLYQGLGFELKETNVYRLKF